MAMKKLSLQEVLEGIEDTRRAYTGPAAPSARNFSPTLPEESPTPRK